MVSVLRCNILRERGHANAGIGGKTERVIVKWRTWPIYTLTAELYYRCGHYSPQHNRTTDGTDNLLRIQVAISFPFKRPFAGRR